MLVVYIFSGHSSLYNNAHVFVFLNANNIHNEDYANGIYVGRDQLNKTFLTFQNGSVN